MWAGVVTLIFGFIWMVDAGLGETLQGESENITELVTGGFIVLSGVMTLIGRIKAKTVVTK